MKSLVKLQALQMMANSANSGITVHSFQQQDKRRTVPMFFANIGTVTISPVLDYTALNCFLMGYSKAIRSK
jgi:hypothetical protein